MIANNEVTYTDADVIESVRLVKTKILNGQNNNKFWNSDFVRVNGRTYEVSEWGRVGSKADNGVWPRGKDAWYRKISDKRRDDYKEVVTVAVANTRGVSVTRSLPAVLPDMSSLCAEFVRWAGVQAAESIKTFLRGEVNDLAPQQVEKGFALLHSMQQASRRDVTFGRLLEEYYNTIPTILPRKPDAWELARDFDFAEQEQRLHMLKSAVAASSVENASFKFKIKEAPADIVTKIMQMVRDTSDERINPKGIFVIQSPDVEAYNGCKIGNEATLFHGTRQRATRYILDEGIICAKHADSRLMFGAGKYFSPHFRKSLNYTDGGHTNRLIFVCDVKLGKVHLAKEPMKGIYKPPQGFDSVWGKRHYTSSYGGTLENDEHIVYTEPQSVIRAAIWC